jgi:hypothetical protein
MYVSLDLFPSNLPIVISAMNTAWLPLLIHPDRMTYDI